MVLPGFQTRHILSNVSRFFGYGFTYLIMQYIIEKAQRKFINNTSDSAGVTIIHIVKSI